MKVYVALHNWHHEGSDIVGIYATEELANKHLIKMGYYKNKTDDEYTSKNVLNGLRNRAFIKVHEVVDKTTKFAWLLEFKSTIASLYLKNSQTACFDPNDALKFETREEALRFRECVIEDKLTNCNIKGFEPAEHGFVE